MVYSMTAYASKNVSLPGGFIARWEIRSTNHRYLEVSFKLPPLQGDLEYRLRENLRKIITRGKVDCFLKLDAVENNKRELNIDFNLVEQLVVASQKISARFPVNADVAVFDILRMPSVVCLPETDLSGLEISLQESFLTALQDLTETRAREGEKLGGYIEERLVKMRERLKSITNRLPEIEKATRIKFYEKVNDLQIETDKSRFDQVVANLIQKMDISEELDRLTAHLTEVERVLKDEKVMGRRLDFLMQELNRESNTVGSKAIDTLTVQDAITFKVLIEEMREQIQNIE
ncbi:MAG TPA: YicC/YloC family endoribonuclease [Gammaproteobacteria bacterium]|nr:YicC/YloC family endoribonuclease [Gammaproteobacteria bacterium]